MTRTSKRGFVRAEASASASRAKWDDVASHYRAALVEAKAADAQVDALLAGHQPQPDWPSELTRQRPGYVERYTLESEVRSHFPAAKWPRLLALLAAAQVAAGAGTRRTYTPEIDAAFDAAERASEALHEAELTMLATPLGRAADLPLKLAVAIGYFVPGPCELGHFDPQQPAHVEWAVSAPEDHPEGNEPTDKARAALGLYLDAVAIAQGRV